MNMEKKKLEQNKIDWMITLVPLGIVVMMAVLFFLVPERSNVVVSQIRYILGDTFGVYYLMIGLGIFLVSIYIACSRYGDMKNSVGVNLSTGALICLPLIKRV